MQGTISYQYMSLGVYTGMHSFSNNYIIIERLQNKSNEKLFYQLAFLHGAIKDNVISTTKDTWQNIVANLYM